MRFGIILVGLCSLSCLATTVGTAAERPNIMWIFVEDMNAWMGTPLRPNTGRPLRARVARERHQLASTCVVRGVFSIADSRQNDQVAVLRYEANRPLALPRKYPVLRGNQPVVKVADEHESMGHRLKTLDGTFGRVGRAFVKPQVGDVRWVEPGFDV